MSDRISTLRLFRGVARSGSFTAAGREAGLSQPSVSRIISKLEADLGAALFVRSTHAVQLTEAGNEYLESIDGILSSLDEANHMVRGDGTLRGRLRLGSAISFAQREVIPRLPEFLEANPELEIDLVLDDSFQELIDQSIDVALRFGALNDSTMVARRLTESPRILAASPAYLEKAGTLESPADLARHKIVLGPSSWGAAGWSFKKDDREFSIKVERQLMVTVNEASTVAALAGLGIVSTSLSSCRAEIESGRLVRLLPDWDIGKAEVHAVLAAGKNAKPSARAFTDYLVEKFKKDAA